MRARGTKQPNLTDKGPMMGDIISIVYTVVIFTALVSYVTFCRKV
jgi:hypothetical protein